MAWRPGRSRSCETSPSARPWAAPAASAPWSASAPTRSSPSTSATTSRCWDDEEGRSAGPAPRPVAGSRPAAPRPRGRARSAHVPCAARSNAGARPADGRIWDGLRSRRPHARRRHHGVCLPHRRERALPSQRGRRAAAAARLDENRRARTLRAREHPPGALPLARCPRPRSFRAVRRPLSAPMGGRAGVRGRPPRGRGPSPAAGCQGRVRHGAPARAGRGRGAARDCPAPAARELQFRMSDFDIAAVFAHADDAELTCGGTLALEAARGRRGALVDLTRGARGSRGRPAARLLGAAHRESLGLPASRLVAIPEQRDVVVEALRRLRPRIVLLPHWEQRHPDHAAASRLVYDAWFVAGLRNYQPELGTAFRPAKLIYAPSVTEAVEVAPSFVVDITSAWDAKLRALGAFESQFQPAASDAPNPLDGFRGAAEVSARRAGQRIGVTFGEAFVTREPIQLRELTAAL